jgi:protein transport protein SEC31
VLTSSFLLRFYDIAWGPPSADHPRGIIAGASENGSLDLWDAEKLIAGASDAFMSRTTKHTGAIKTVQFNPLKPQLLATAGAKGELFVYDINDISTPFRLGNAAARSDDIDCLAWNRKVPNILATGGVGGFVTVWDLKTKKASLTLNNNRKPVSAIAWDPNNSTKLLTASPDDNAPVILLWDLRNSNAPERTLQGHEAGVLSLSWCQQDPDLLISCGKDNRTLVWNPQTGERYGEFPEVTNWTFMTRFNPYNPNLSATASFDGKITIQTLQNTNPSASQATTQSSLDGEDFFTKAQTQPQSASFSLAKAPAWLQRPVGVSFGYGGKLVILKPTPGKARSSQIQISHFSVDSDIGSAVEKFEEALKGGNTASICEAHLNEAKTEEEKAEWQVLQTLSSSDGRTKIVEYLGFGKDEAAEDETAAATEEKDTAQTNGAIGHKRQLSWGDGEDDDFLADLAATKGAKTDNPFHLLSEGNTALEDQITKALLVGNFTKAADICLKENRMADAFIIANCGGKDLVDKVQSAYLASKKGSPSYLRLLGSVVTKNLWDVVYNADLADWKESMVTLCTFADPSEFPDLCEGLGDRIFESGSRKDALFCYLVGSKLEKAVGIWISELEEQEQAGIADSASDSTFSVHARSLQQFIEKVAIFREATKFADNEKSLTSGWKLDALYDKYTEYADIVAAHGHLDVAQKYLDLLPTQYPPAEVARNRVRLATQKAAPQMASRQPAASRQATTTTRAASRPQQYTTPSPAPLSNTSNLSPYGAPTPQPAVQPALTPVQNPYAPPGQSSYQPASQPPYAPPTQSYNPSPAPVGGYAPPMGYGQQTPYGAPPRANQPPTAPYKPKDVGDWNDVPMVVKAPARKTTPRVAPISSPFPGQPGISSPPPPPNAFPGQRATPTPPPPPPKAGPPRNIASPPTAGGLPPPVRPTSAAANTYSPPPSQAGPPPSIPSLMPRTSSPYNAPPSAAPPSNRYAPAPMPQQFNQPPAAAPIAPPPGAARPPPPPNPYAAAPPPSSGPSPYAPGQFDGGAPPVGRPPVGPPPSAGPPPSSGPPPAAKPPPPAAAPPKARHPPGDRSHIPAGAQRLVDILERDMQRVASKAPASFAPQVKDTQKRLGLLFDDLNNQSLIKPDTIGQLSELAEALDARNYDGAQKLQVEIQRDKTEECGNWMVSLYISLGIYYDL